MDEPNLARDLPSEAVVRALLAEIAPGSNLLAIDALPGSYSNYTHLVSVRSPSGSVSRLDV